MTDYNDFNEAKNYIPGGVNSPARSFKSVGGDPVLMSRADGAYIYDCFNNQYIDYVQSWGPMILGHNHPRVTRAVTEAVQQGLSFGAPCPQETQLAAQVCKMVPSIDKVRFVNSGTEATMSALRLARAATGRNKIIKFEGCYHGHHDALLVKAGSGAMTLGQPSSPGVPEGFTQYTLIAQYNDLDSVRELFEAHSDSIAGVIVEPVAGNMGCVPPVNGFLQGLRALCDQHGSLLIFDEVMSGFRVAQGGAQAYYNVRPDLTALGKVVGGGMPVGAFGGRADIMDLLAPEGPVYQAGTLAGNPLAMAAGLATLKAIEDQPGFYQTIDSNAARLKAMLEEQANHQGVPIVVNQAGGMISLFFTELEQVTTHSEVQQADQSRFARYFHSLLDSGVYWPPSPFESAFISITHDKSIINQTGAATEHALEKACTRAV